MKYTIKTGDTLNGIARRFRLGYDGFALFEINRENLRSGRADLIFPGEIIDIPEQQKPSRPFPLLQNAEQDEVVLFLGDEFFTKWDAYSFSSSLDNLCSTFSLTSSPSEAFGKIERGTQCFFSIGQTPLGVFYVEKIARILSNSEFSFTLNGRSKGLDLVDSSAITNKTVWRNVKLETIIEELIRPFGLSLDTNGIDTGAAVDKFKIEQGQSVLEAIQRELKKRRIFLTDTAEEKLRFFRAPEKDKVSGTITEGDSNLVSINFGEDDSKRFSEYVVVGQAKKKSNVRAVKKDNRIVRPRRKTIISEEITSNSQAIQRAGWESSLAEASSQSYSAKLSRWRRSDGGIWQKGEQLRLVSDSLNIDQILMIKSVSRSYSTQAEDTDLTLVRPEVYENV